MKKSLSENEVRERMLPTGWVLYLCEERGRAVPAMNITGGIPIHRDGLPVPRPIGASSAGPGPNAVRPYIRIRAPRWRGKPAATSIWPGKPARAIADFEFRISEGSQAFFGELESAEDGAGFVQAR